MSNQNSSDDVRKTAMTRFILIYIISILCAVIPLYYLFNIPGRAIRSLKVSEFSSRGEMKKIQRMDEIMGNLDKNMQESKFEKEYRDGIDALYRFTKDSIRQNNIYRPQLMKLSDLYEKIGKIYLEGGKAEVERLKDENKALTAEKKQLEQDVKDLERENLKLLMSK